MDQPYNLEEIYLNIIRFMLFAKQKFSKIALKSELNGMQAIMLIYLRKPTPIGALNKLFGYDPSNITSIIDSLEKRQMVARIENSLDRRMKVVELTSLGEEVRSNLLTDLASSENISDKIASGQMHTFNLVMEELLKPDKT